MFKRMPMSIGAGSSEGAFGGGSTTEGESEDSPSLPSGISTEGTSGIGTGPTSLGVRQVPQQDREWHKGHSGSNP